MGEQNTVYTCSYMYISDSNCGAFDHASRASQLLSDIYYNTQLVYERSRLLYILIIF